MIAVPLPAATLANYMSIESHENRDIGNPAELDVNDPYLYYNLPLRPSISDRWKEDPARGWTSEDVVKIICAGRRVSEAL